MIKLKIIFKYLISGLVIASLLIIAFLHFSKTGHRLSIKAKQYLAININKNSGIQYYTLVAIEGLLALFPSNTLIPFNREESHAGAHSNKSGLSDILDGYDSVIDVTNSEAFIYALENAEAGQLILLSPGQYRVNTHALSLQNAGQINNPIVLATERLGDVTIELNSVEGIYLNKANWIIKNLIFEGVCALDSNCEHAIHFVGNADNVIIDNNIFTNFNAAIKANGNYRLTPFTFADNVKITNNDFYNKAPRNTDTPSTPIDIVGGDNWYINQNFIADFSRKIRGTTSIVYGAFLKGAGRQGELSDNVINCAWKLPYQSVLDVRIGLSLGNGGTNEKFCQRNNCDFEHDNGVIKNNLVLNCINDVGIYINKASNTKLLNNVILNSLGIEARSAKTTIIAYKNDIDGDITKTQGAKINIINQ